MPHATIEGRSKYDDGVACDIVSVRDVLYGSRVIQARGKMDKVPFRNAHPSQKIWPRQEEYFDTFADQETCAQVW